MLKILERNIDSAGGRLVLLAPAHARVPAFSTNVVADARLHRRLVGEVQRARGAIYLADGAIRPNQLTADGRHETAEDLKSWHLMVVGDDGSPNGCIWYLDHQHLPSFNDLRLRHAAIAQDPEWGPKLREAVASDVERARCEGVSYAEVGGWAVSKDSRLTDCLLLVLGSFCVSQSLGGALVAVTATVRHASAAVLRRLGGAHIEGSGFTVPSYFDPAYDCEMEILRFDSRRPAAKFARMIETLQAKFPSIPVIAADPQPSISAGRVETSVSSRFVSQMQRQLAAA